jgi:hypothetical protein
LHAVCDLSAPAGTETKADAKLESLQRTLDEHTQAQRQEELAYKYAERISALESGVRLMGWFLGALTLSSVGQLGLRPFGYGTLSERGRRRRAESGDSP